MLGAPRSRTLKVDQQLEANFLADLETAPSQATRELRAQIERAEVG
jgi:hypothetical protein